MSQGKNEKELDKGGGWSREVKGWGEKKGRDASFIISLVSFHEKDM
jgi:hypothetical protein